MYAIVEITGKQYKVEKGNLLDVDKLSAAPEEKITLEKVLMISDGENQQIGQPYLSGAKVIAQVIETRKSKKVIVFKYKRKTGYHRKSGHRQLYTRLQIEEIQS